jgi:uncharacterized membrane protein
MSFDPYGYRDQPQQPPDGTAPVPVDLNALNAQHAAATAARDRVMLPGVFLLVLGVLNGLFTAFLAFCSYTSLNAPPEVLAKAKADLTPAQREQFAKLEEMGYTYEGIIRTFGKAMSIMSVVSLLCTVLMILGGVRMIALRSYALCMFAAVFTAIPCVSGCCCMGQVVGIWAAIVLLNDDVRRAFR